MLMRKWKLSLLTLSLAFLLILCACSVPTQNTTATTQQQGTSESQNTSSEPISFSYILPTKYVNWLKDLLWYPEFEKAVNAKVDIIEGGDGDIYYSGIDLKVASGEFPDSGIVKVAQSDVYGKQGAFVDLKPLIEKYAPNIKKYIEANPDFSSLIETDEGAIYGLPAEIPRLSNVTMFRTEHLKQAGITENPSTIDEFTEVLRKLKQSLGGDANYFPYSGQDAFLQFAPAFGANDYIDSDGKVHGIYAQGMGFDIHAPGYKQMIEWYKLLYDEKLIDPEWVSGAITEIVWETKFMTGKTTYADNWFTNPTNFMVQVNDANYHVDVMPYFKDNNGAQIQRPTSPRFNLTREFVINSKSKNIEGIMRYMDFAYSQEGQTIRNYGVEGKTYKVVNGQKEYIVKFEEEWPKKVGTPNNGFFQDRLTFPGPVDNDAFYLFLDDFTKSYAKNYFTSYTKVFDAMQWSVAQLEERSNLMAKVSTAVDANAVKFVMGERPFAEFDSFIKEMDNLGYNRITEIDQAAYDAQK